MLKEEHKDEALAQILHKAGHKAMDREEDKMARWHRTNERMAKLDHIRYLKEERHEEALQDAGHKMQAVPTTRLASRSDRAHTSTYLHSLGGKERRTKVHEAKTRKMESMAVGFLSSDEARKQQDSFFKELDKEVDKTPKVLAAEIRAEKMSRLRRMAVHVDDKSAIERSSEYNDEAHEAVPKGRLSEAESRAKQQQWFDDLDKKVHKTPRVIAAEQAAKHSQHELEQEVAQSDSSAQRSRTEWRRNQAVPAGRLSEERYAKKQDKYFEQLDGKVLACLGLVRGAWQARVRA